MLGEAEVSQGPGSVWDVGKGGRERERDTKYIRVRPTQGGTEKLKKRRLDKYWSRMAKVLL